MFSKILLSILITAHCGFIFAQSQGLNKLKNDASQISSRRQDQGMSCLLGAGIALGASTIYSIRSQEMFSKTGYSMMQGASILVALEGFDLLFNADPIEDDAAHLAFTNRLLRLRRTYSEEEVQSSLNKIAQKLENRRKIRSQGQHLTRGLVGVGAAFSGALTMSFSKMRTPLSLAAPAILTLSGLVFGLSELMATDKQEFQGAVSESLQNRLAMDTSIFESSSVPLMTFTNARQFGLLFTLSTAL